jgi:pimeloyl-ACP methyl ester carboxylesterase
MQEFRRSFAVVAIFFLLILAGCSSGPDPSISTQSVAQTAIAQTAQVQTPTAIPATDDPFPGEGPWPVTITTSDNALLAGTVFGKSGPGVVLAPMYPGGAEDWQTFALTAASQGYRVLTFDLRGYGKSEGERSSTSATMDIVAATSYLKGLGADRITLIGAGVSGTASIKVALEDPSIAALAVISSPRAIGDLSVEDLELSALSQPSLWLAARNDMTNNIEELYNAAGGAKSLWIYEGSSLQGTFILEGADSQDMQQRLLDLIASANGP